MFVVVNLDFKIESLSINSVFRPSGHSHLSGVPLLRSLPNVESSLAFEALVAQILAHLQSKLFLGKLKTSTNNVDITAHEVIILGRVDVI